MNHHELSIIRRLVGKASPEQLRHIDCYLSPWLGVFVPSTGPCFYARTPKHTHPAYSFIYTFPGQQIPQEQKRVFRPGLITAFSPDWAHEEPSADGFVRYAAIMIGPLFFARAAAHYSLGSRTFKCDFFPPVPGYGDCLREFMQEAEQSLPGRAAVLQALAVRLLHATLRSLHPAGMKPVRSDRSLDAVAEYMQQAYDQPLTVAALASRAAMSDSRFSRQFHGRFGQPPIQYLIHLRLKKARTLLQTGEYSVSEVALRCGFSHASHLTDWFKKIFHETPGSFQRHLR